MQLITKQAIKRYDAQHSTSNGRRRWVVGVCVGVLAVLLFVLAVSCSTSSIRANNRQCLEQLAHDEHTTLEAFFQNPADQDALVQAITQCTR